MSNEEGNQLLAADALRGKALGISVSESPDLGRLGLVEDHFRLALAEIARTILVSGGELYYGGHLQPEGYTKFLIQELQKYGRRNQPLKLCLAWTEHRKMAKEEIEASRQDLGLLGEVILLSEEGNKLSTHYEPAAPLLNFARETQYRSLSGLRSFMATQTDGRILLGGKRTGFQGTMPGIIEEALSAVRNGKPLFLAGGYGGATLSAISVLNPINAEWFPLKTASVDDDPRTEEALQLLKEVAHGVEWTKRSNGLSSDENCLLAATYRPSEIATLVGLGLGRLETTPQS